MILFSTLALADIPPTPPIGRQFVSHEVKVANLAAHPDFVLLLYASSGEISTYRKFDADTARVDIGGELHTAGFWLMSRADFDIWAAETSAETMRQRTACAERGEGCAHISRFTPRFAPPASATSCGVSLNAASSAPFGDPTSEVHSFTLESATAAACGLKSSAEAPVETLETLEDKATPATELAPSGEGAGCAAVGGASLSAVVLSMLLGLRRRCGF